MIDIGIDYENLPDVLIKYEDILDGAYDNLTIKGKTLEAANREQPVLLFTYDQHRVELETLLKYFEYQSNKVRSNLFKNFTENFSIELGDRAKQLYIDREPTFNTINSLLLEVRELCKKYESLAEAFKARGYALKNITDARINQIYNEVI